MTPLPNASRSARLPFRERSRWLRALAIVGTLAAAAILVTRPLWPSRILDTQANDLANHVRHVDEYRMALAEGQCPPLTAPRLNGGVRIPMFQYYTGTAYALSGLLGLSGLNPYQALKTAVAVHSFLAGLALFGACRLLTRRRFPALVAAVTFQLFPFGAVDLFNRGAFPEWVALQCLPVVLYASLRLARPRSAAGNALAAWTCGLAWAVFIPVHPTHTLYSGAVVLLLAVAHGFNAPEPRRALARLLLACFSGLALSVWFWLPIATDTASLRIGGHLGFFNAHITWPILLSPRFAEAVAELPGWAPQVGLLLVVAAWLAACDRPWPVRVPWLCGHLFLLLLVVIVDGPTLPWVSQVFRGMQWNYRVLIPCALLGSVCVAAVLARIGARLPVRAGLLVQASVLLAVVVVAWPYFRVQCVAYVPQPCLRVQRVAYVPQPYLLTVADVQSPDYLSLNSSYYAFQGMDVRSLGWVNGGRLIVDRDLPVPLDALPLTFELTLAGTDRSDLRCRVNGQPRALRCATDADGRLRVTGTVRPRLGMVALPEDDLTFRFETPGQPQGPQVCDFRCCGADGVWFRPFPPGQRQHASGGKMAVEAPQAGLYQIPVLYTPRLGAQVNGKPVQHASSDRFLLIVPLETGPNKIVLKQRWPVAWTASVSAAGLFWLAVLLLPAFRNRMFGGQPTQARAARQATAAARAA